MLLTEREAREKECRAAGMYPFYSVLASDLDDSGNLKRPLASAIWPRCSASECMTGWRWFDGPAVHDPKVCPNKDTRRGFCGFGGRPEE